MIPLRYAIRDNEEQRRIADRIVDIRTLRDRRTTTLSFSGHDPEPDRPADLDAVRRLRAELDELEAPFRAPYRRRRALDADRFDHDGADLDEAQFLRLFDGDPAIAGDILLAQVETRVASPVFEALLGLSAGELREATAWFRSLATIDDIPFARSTDAIAELYDAAARGALIAAEGRPLVDDPEDGRRPLIDDRDVGPSLPFDPVELERLPAMATFLRLRSERFRLFRERPSVDRILEPQSLDRTTRVAGITLPADTVRSAYGTGSRLARVVADQLRRERRDGDDEGEGETEPPLPTSSA